MTTTIVVCKWTESEMDEFLRGASEMGRALNFIQTIREREDVRLAMKRAACVVELHRAHVVDLTYVCPYVTREEIESIEPHVEAYLFGEISCIDLQDRLIQNKNEKNKNQDQNQNESHRTFS